MSTYDPFNIYSKKSKKTHIGQVIRKKIPNYIGYCFTNEELDRAIEGLIARGYHIFNPGVRIPQTIYYSNVYTLSTGSLIFQNLNDILTFNFSTLWNNVFNDFSRYLQVDPIITKNVLFRVDIISINLFGRFQLPNANNTGSDINFYFFDPNTPIDIAVASHDFAADSNNNIYSLQSFNNQTLLGTYRITRYSNNITSYSSLIAKRENTNEPYLYSIIRQQPAILTALRNQDYTAFNPDLYSAVFTGYAPGPLSIANSSLCVRVHLQYDV